MRLAGCQGRFPQLGDPCAVTASTQIDKSTVSRLALNTATVGLDLVVARIGALPHLGGLSEEEIVLAVEKVTQMADAKDDLTPLPTTAERKLAILRPPLRSSWVRPAGRTFP